MRRLALFLLIVFLLVGCSHLSVRHLAKNPFQLNETNHLSMRYWNFEYMTVVDNGDYIVRGVAMPKTSVIPGWAEWLHDFWISVYLSDEKGVVLAKDLKVFPTQKLDRVHGVNFEFQMEPEKMPSSQDTYLTFGYRMRMTESQFHSPETDRPLTGDKSVFFASEGALAR
ncbi:hypothetical protein [Desulfonatronovibrio magnus]|uniref:hypothetical protein n=1 Tax=Desulfonatronovibrio magnus TaxID=698827 RepID=UPI000695F695|nr:hypothetical protein [Desulfonatronovibrio magnus]